MSMESIPKNTPSARRSKNLGYPIVLTVFILIVLALFFTAARFLSANIDSAISSPDETLIQAQLTHINMQEYESVREKLKLPTLQPRGEDVSIIEVPTTTEMIAPSPISISEQRSAESKSTFQIAVWNSTAKSGVAGTLRNDLVAAGFTVTKTGNKTTKESQTRIQIKEHVQASPTILEEVLMIVGKRFATGDPEILESTSPYDIVITIGVR